MIKVCEKEWILEVSSISPTLMVDTAFLKSNFSKSDETYNFNIFEMLINIKKSNWAQEMWCKIWML